MGYGPFSVHNAYGYDRGLPVHFLAIATITNSSAMEYWFTLADGIIMWVIIRDIFAATIMTVVIM